MEMVQKLRRILKRSTVKTYVFVLLFLLAAGSSFLEILPSEIIGRFSNRLITLQPGDAMHVVLAWCGFYFLVVACGTLVRNLFCFLTSKTANTLIRDIRNLAFAKMLTVDLSLLSNPDSGYFVNMVNGNCARLETVFSVALFTLVSDVFDLFWISVFICATDWKLLGIMAAFVPILYLLGRKSSQMQRTLAVQRIDVESQIISKINGAVANRPAIRIFDGQKREEDDFRQCSGAYCRKSNRSDAALSFFYIAEKSIRYIAISLVIFVTALEIVRGNYAVGSLISIVLYSQKFYAPITNIIRYIQMLQKGMASVDSLESFLDREDTKEDENIQFSAETPFAAVDGAEVTVDGKTILPKTSFPLEEGTLTILRGPSGCGKSTLIKALLGERRLTGGSIRMHPRLKSQNRYSYASQDMEIFGGTILENALYPQFPEAVPPHQLARAEALLARLGFPKDTWGRSTGEGGSTLSGGEKKRICFARALLRPSDILILDEITSNLDEASENTVAQMIAEESRHRCVILITHKHHPAYDQAAVRPVVMAENR